MWSYLRYLLLALAAVHALSVGSVVIDKLASLDGLLIGEATPVAGDFINLYAAAQLTLQGRAHEVVDPERFAAFERTIIPEDIGFRLWAYPPHSLLLAWPFGLLGFFLSLTLFSALGLWLLALGARRDGDRVSVLGAALLTIKPQMGFLLPVLWLIQRRWKLIALTSVATLALVGLTLLLWGPGIWEDYRGKSLTLLDQFEREGTRPFLHMIPSVFIAGRVLALPSDLALIAHAAFALAVGGLLVWRLIAVRDNELRTAMVLIAPALISPYLHSYDLAMLAAGGLIVARRCLGPMDAATLLVALVILVNWALPNLLLTLNAAGWPVAPAIILALFLVAAFRPAADPLLAPEPAHTIDLRSR